MQLALSTTFAPPSIPVRDELSGNLRQGFTTKNPDWNPGPNVVNSTVQIGFWPSLILDGVRQSHSARYYNPITGRFMSRDPEDHDVRGPDGTPTDPKELHKYLYAGGDPVNRVDPSGRGDLIEVSMKEWVRRWREILFTRSWTYAERVLLCVETKLLGFEVAELGLNMDELTDLCLDETVP